MATARRSPTVTAAIRPARARTATSAPAAHTGRRLTREHPRRDRDRHRHRGRDQARCGAYLVAGWLSGIIVNLLSYSGYYDVAPTDARRTHTRAAHQQVDRAQVRPPRQIKTASTRGGPRRPRAPRWPNRRRRTAPRSSPTLLYRPPSARQAQRGLSRHPPTEHRLTSKPKPSSGRCALPLSQRASIRGATADVRSSFPGGSWPRTTPDPGSCARAMFA
jgi:hypothetical protein